MRLTEHIISVLSVEVLNNSIMGMAALTFNRSRERFELWRLCMPWFPIKIMVFVLPISAI